MIQKFDECWIPDVDLELNYSGKLSKILDFEIKFKTRLKHKSKMSFKILFHLINIFLFRFFKKNFS